ncbi:hypothetical protein [Massilia sp. GCM10023247]|uniref:hypothetical protein n=1 Tax=Massilia sp. GCM10023247 TaxID=3252643 RepID=UPI00361824C2
MSLPDLAWQIAYGRLAWGVVIAAMLVALWPAARRLPRPAFGAVLAVLALLMALPGEASPAYWLGLAFQYPSGMLLGLCLLGLHARWQGRAAGDFMPLSAAAAIAIAGAALYLDAIGWLSQGYYYAGFGPFGAPAVALAAIAGCALALLRGRGGRQNLALLGALLLFTLLRLPTGNLWDAVLDPLLWAWALATLARRAGRRIAGFPARRKLAEADPGLEPELPALRTAAPIEQFSISKE